MDCKIIFFLQPIQVLNIVIQLTKNNPTDVI